MLIYKHNILIWKILVPFLGWTGVPSRIYSHLIDPVLYCPSFRNLLLLNYLKRVMTGNLDYLSFIFSSIQFSLYTAFGNILRKFGSRFINEQTRCGKNSVDMRKTPREDSQPILFLLTLNIGESLYIHISYCE